MRRIVVVITAVRTKGSVPMEPFNAIGFYALFSDNPKIYRQKERDGKFRYMLKIPGSNKSYNCRSLGAAKRMASKLSNNRHYMSGKGGK
jgi:hypothetical protein